MTRRMWLLLLTCASLQALGNPYEEQRAAAVASCSSIDPDESRSGMVLNPDGLRSYYVRSKCFSDAAVTYRDAELCGEVRRRWLSPFSSWKVSSSECEKQVADGIRNDEAALTERKRAYLAGHVELAGFTVYRHGNRRDFEVVPTFGGTGRGTYLLTLTLVASGQRHDIHNSGYSIDSGTSNIGIYLRASDISAAYPGFSPAGTYDLEATLTYAIGSGTTAGRWSDDFINRHFPTAERSEHLMRTVAFGGLDFRPYEGE